MKKYFTGIITFFFPSFFVIFLLRVIGHKVGKKFKVGFSFIFVDELIIEENVKIGHFNLFLNEKLKLQSDSYIGYLNILKGPFKLYLCEKAAIGNKNYLTRAQKGITYGDSILHLGELTKITVGHHLDLTRSIIFGKFSILAGINSQLWTHGYYHADKGKERIRIDGEIHIGDNVYIGSSCIFNPGLSVANAIHIGGGSVISKNLKKSGMYVGQELRFIENNIDRVKGKLNKVEALNLIEQVYIK